MAKGARVGVKGVSVAKEKPVVAKLRHAAGVAISEVLGVREGEEVLIVTNFEGEAFTIAKELYDAARAAGGRAVMMIVPERTVEDREERLVIEAMNACPDVILYIASNMWGYDPYGLAVGYVGRDGKKYSHPFLKLTLGDRRARIITSAEMTAEMIERTVPVDYASMRAMAGRLKAVLDDGKGVHLTAPAGTDLTLSIEGRKAMIEVGDARAPGVYDNIPCGEVCISPAIASCRGVIVFDGTLALNTRSVLPKMPVRVTLKDGYVDTVEGGEDAKLLLESIEFGERLAREKGDAAALKNARHLGELGIGLNPAARMSGLMIEDEKLLRTVHLAIGRDYDGMANAFIHLDCLIKEPSLWIDGKLVMKDGDLLV